MLPNTPETLVFVIIAALAVYRLAQLLAYDLGPWHSIEKARLYLGQQAHRHGRASLWHQASEWLRCPYCSGIWFSALAASVYAPNFIAFVLLTLAVAGLAALLETVSQRQE